MGKNGHHIPVLKLNLKINGKEQKVNPLNFYRYDL